MRSATRRALFALAAVLLLHASALAQAPARREIDTQQSRALFSVSHIWVEHVTGTVPIERGEVVLPSASWIPLSVVAVLDATQIRTGDPDRDSALRSPDFFDTKRFPQWTFSSTKIVPKGPSAFEIDGDLTIHGVTQPEELSVTISGDPQHPLYHATGQIDRHAFGMAITRLDPVIGSVVNVTLEIALTRR